MGKCRWLVGMLVCTVLLPAHANDQFLLQAAYKDAALASLDFDYRAGGNKAVRGFLADGNPIPGSACYARIPGSDNLNAFLTRIKNQPVYRGIADTRQRMQDALAKNRLEIWQEVLCTAPANAIPYPETGNGHNGKWSSIPIYLNGERQGAWNDVFTVVRPGHLYSVTVHPKLR